MVLSECVLNLAMRFLVWLVIYRLKKFTHILSSHALRLIRAKTCLPSNFWDLMCVSPGVWQEEWVPLWGGCSILLFRFLRAIYVITYFYVDFGDWSVALADVGAWPLCELLLLLRLQRAGWCRRFHFESLPDLPLREAISIKRRQFSLLLSCC